MPPALPEVVDSISAEGSWSLLMSAATVQGHNARSFLSLPQERVTLLGFAHRTMRASHSHLLTRPWRGKSFPTIPKCRATAKAEFLGQRLPKRTSRNRF